MQVRELYTRFRSRFGEEPRIFQAPGRINIIGEHTDYTEGWVLPAGINRFITVAISISADTESVIVASDNQQETRFSVEEVQSYRGNPEFGWAAYVLGVVDQLQKLGLLVPEFNACFSGDIPVGSGLSSSAALECSFLMAFNTLLDLALSPVEMAKLAQRAENEYVGMRCGIMDQFVSIHAREHTALMLDCHELTYTDLPIQLHDYAFVLVNSGVKHELASSEYNTRRAECEEGIKILHRHFPEIRSLRGCTLELLEQVKAALSPTVFSRCQFVIEENERVHRAADALFQNELSVLGNLMYQSHYGLRDLYEVSCTELDLLVEWTEKKPEVAGSRMMGGGFGGCTLNLVEKAGISTFIKDIGDWYAQQTGIYPEMTEVRTSDGAHEIE